MKKCMVIVLTVLFLLPIRPLSAAPAWEGNGTPDDPYIIGTAEELWHLSDEVYQGKRFRGCHFLLTADIALNDATSFYRWEDVLPPNMWRPIGRIHSQFEGVFDGGHHTISGLYIGEDTSYAGLFGCVKGGEIRRLTIADSVVLGGSSVGLLVGQMDGGSISDVSVSGIVRGDEYVGGLAGQVYDIAIEQTMSRAQVSSGDKYAGGLVGYLSESTVRNSAAKEEVCGARSVGGLVGYAEGSGLFAVYTTGDVEADSLAGGLVGYADEDSVLDGAYTTGNITAETYAGGLAGAFFGRMDNGLAKGYVKGSSSAGIVAVASSMNEAKDVTARINNCSYAKDRADAAVAYIAEDETFDIEEISPSRLTGNYLYRYVLTGEYLSASDRKEHPDHVWIYDNEAMPVLFFEKEATEDKTMVLTIGKTEVLVFGHAEEMDTPPLLMDNRTMLPARFVAEALGGQVTWKEESREVVITGAGVTLVIPIGSSAVRINEKAHLVDAPAFIEGERTYTPLRLVAEALGADVAYDEAARRVIITKQ